METPKKILIVDDETESLEYLKNILERENYNVYITDKGAEAFDLAKHHLPDLIIVDIVMPDMEGSEVMATLRQDPSTENIPVIVISGSVLRKEDQILNNFPGAQHVLAKPITPSEVIELANKVLRPAP